MKIDAQALVRKAVLEHGEGLKLKDVNLPKMVRIDGAASVGPNGFERVNTMDQDYNRTVQDMGFYGSNNGRTSWVDAKGQQWLARADEETIEALRAAGYRGNGIYVPFSNGEQALDPNVVRGLDVLRHGLDSEVNMSALNRVAGIKAEAEKKGVSPLTAEQEAGFFKLDGFFTQHLDAQPILHRNIIESQGRWQNIGHYDSNNGIIAFVDDKGSTWVGEASAANHDALESKGYTHASMNVPMSNGEAVIGFASPRHQQGRDWKLPDNYIRLDEIAQAQISKAMGRTASSQPHLPKPANEDGGADVNVAVPAAAANRM